jgi:hypothetical protein
LITIKYPIRKRIDTHGQKVARNRNMMAVEKRSVNINMNDTIRIMWKSQKYPKVQRKGHLENETLKNQTRMLWNLMKMISLLSTRDDTRKHEEKRGDHRDEHSRDGHEKPRHRDDRNNTPEKLNKAKELQKIKEQEKELKKERELAREKDLELARNRENSKEQDRSNSKEEPSKKPKKSRHASPHHKKRKNSAENSEQPKKRSSKDDGKKKSVYEPSDSEEDIKIDRKKIGPAIPREFLEQIQRKAENSERDSEHYDTISSSENDEDLMKNDEKLRKFE